MRSRWNRVSGFSAYAKANSHLLQRTVHGAVVTLLGAFLAIVLLCSEIYQYAPPYYQQEMGVDGTRGHTLRIELDVTFPALPCPLLSLDVVDVAGKHSNDQSLAKDGELRKVRLDPTGRPIGVDQHIRARESGGIDFSLYNTRQVLDDAVEHHEGCHLHGWLDVKRVAGNFHLSIHPDNFFQLRKTQEELAEQLREQLLHSHGNALELHHDLSDVNVSHVIHKLSFGQQYPGQINPLDGVHRIVQVSSGTFKYFLKVVPTVFRDLSNRVMDANQYSVTEYYSRVPVSGSSTLQHLPSVWFLYDLSPVMMTVTQKRKSVAHLLVRICAVVGGVFAFTGMLDRWVHRLMLLYGG